MASVYDVPVTSYLPVGDLSLAYQVLGEGGTDVVFVPTVLSHLDHLWEHPQVARSLRRLSGMGRLVTYDRRDTGLSDASSSPYTLADEADDLLALLDAVGVASAALVTHLYGGPVACYFAAAHPDRVRSLVLHHCTARTTYAEDYPWAPRAEERSADEPTRVSSWGTGTRAQSFAPSWTDDPDSRAWLNRLERLAAGPRSAARLREYIGEMDIRAVLPAIKAPTLVTRRRDNRYFDPRHTTYLAEHIPSARLLELPGQDLIAFAGDSDGWIDAVGTFIDGQPPPSTPQRMLTTLMFSDIVGSTEMLAQLGDSAWRQLLTNHDALARREIARFGGHAIKSLGDGFFARFDATDSAAACGLSMIAAAGELGVSLRVGVHRGECEAIGEDLAGLTVHEAARIAAAAGAGELLVSDGVKTAGIADVAFEDRGEVTLKGLPNRYRLWRARPER